MDQHCLKISIKQLVIQREKTTGNYIRINLHRKGFCRGFTLCRKGIDKEKERKKVKYK